MADSRAKVIASLIKATNMWYEERLKSMLYCEWDDALENVMTVDQVKLYMGTIADDPAAKLALISTVCDGLGSKAKLKQGDNPSTCYLYTSVLPCFLKRSSLLRKSEEDVGGKDRGRSCSPEEKNKKSDEKNKKSRSRSRERRRKSRSKSRSRGRYQSRKHRRSRSRSRTRSRGRRIPSPRDRRSDRSDRSRDGGSGKLTGIACRWNERGFGFIQPDGGGDDVFCHVSAITDGNSLRDGDKVMYESVFDERKGKSRAQNVTGGTTIDDGFRGGYSGTRSGHGGGRSGDYDDRQGRDRYDYRRGGDRYNDRGR